MGHLKHLLCLNKLATKTITVIFDLNKTKKTVWQQYGPQVHKQRVENCHM